MGSGSWTSQDFERYSRSMGRAVGASGVAEIKGMSAAQVYRARSVNDLLNPKGVLRECRDSEEHPNTIPVILALDVTGSMGETAVEVAAELNKIMTRLYDEVKDVEFMIVGVGDFVYDDGPLQVSQFESDIRIAEQLDLLWFEFGGGGNDWESYTASWAFAERQIDLDCWKRGKKGIIITMGDEKINPCLRKNEIAEFIGDSVQADVDTASLYEQVKEKFDVHHIAIDDPSSCYSRYNRNGGIDEAWSMLGENYHVSTVNGLQDMIASIVIGAESKSQTFATNEISW